MDFGFGIILSIYFYFSQCRETLLINGVSDYYSKEIIFSAGSSLSLIIIYFPFPALALPWIRS